MTEWRFDTASIWVAFDSSDMLVIAQFYPRHREEQSLFEKLLSRLERQWRKWFT